MVNVLINNATGSVLQWGATTLVPGPGQSVVVADAETFPEGTPNHFTKVVGTAFVAMTQLERDAVNAARAARSIQRIRKTAEVTATTSQTDPGGGWVDVVPLVTARPLDAGEYQLICSFELGLVATSTTHTAQAQLLYNGSPISEWHNPYMPYQRCTLVESVPVVSGEAPTLQLQIRRFGSGAGTARARRALLVIAPIGTPDFNTTI